MTSHSNDVTNFPHKSLLTDAQAKIILIPLGLTAAGSAIDSAIQKSFLNILGNMLAGKDVIRSGEKVIASSRGRDTIRAGQDF